MESTDDGDLPCTACGGTTVIRPVPDDCRGLLPDDPQTVRLCERCLLVSPAAGAQVRFDWDPMTVSGALPNDPDAALAMGLVVTFLDSLALHRRELETVVAYLERETGVDPLLALDRFAASPDLDPAIDVMGRQQQLAQVLGR